MKRVVIKKIEGVSAKGTKWFLLILGATFKDGVLTLERKVFITEEIFNDIEEGVEIEVAE